MTPAPFYHDMVFISILLGLFGLLAYLSRKYNNPYKLYFIFGKKGAGKSTYMVKEMLKHQKRGWIVYTDVPDVHIDGVRRMRADDLRVFTPEANSVLFLDEVGITFDNRNFKNFNDGTRDFFKFQRKYKVKLYMNSQAFDIDKKIRDVTDKMYLCSSIANCICLIRPISRRVTLTAPSAEAESRIADSLKFDSIFTWRFIYMPRYHKYFDSFSAPERELIPFETIGGDLDAQEVVAQE